MSGYLRRKNAFPSSICCAIDFDGWQYDGLNVRLSQKMQPPCDIVPSLFGQEKPASTEIFCTRNGKR